MWPASTTRPTAPTRQLERHALPGRLRRLGDDDGQVPRLRQRGQRRGGQQPADHDRHHPHGHDAADLDDPVQRHNVRIGLLHRLGLGHAHARPTAAAPASHRSSTPPTAPTPRSRTAPSTRARSRSRRRRRSSTAPTTSPATPRRSTANRSRSTRSSPTSTISCNGNPCGSGWFNGAVSVTLAATDNSGGSGVSQIRYTTNGTTPTATTGNVYTGAFTVSTSGTTVKYRAFDVAGNAETTNSQLLQIDTVAPSSMLRCNGTTCAASFYSAAVSVTLTATDVGGSGVTQIVYTTDGSDPIAVERHRLFGRVHALLDDHCQVPRLRRSPATPSRSTRR